MSLDLCRNASHPQGHEKYTQLDHQDYIANSIYYLPVRVREQRSPHKILVPKQRLQYPVLHYITQRVATRVEPSPPETWTNAISLVAVGSHPQRPGCDEDVLLEHVCRGIHWFTG
jgi:hypothetical protein